MVVNLDSSRRRQHKPREALRSQVRETVRRATEAALTGIGYKIKRV